MKKYQQMSTNMKYGANKDYKNGMFKSFWFLTFEEES